MHSDSVYEEIKQKSTYNHSQLQFLILRVRFRFRGRLEQGQRSVGGSWVKCGSSLLAKEPHGNGGVDSGEEGDETTSPADSIHPAWVAMAKLRSKRGESDKH